MLEEYLAAPPALIIVQLAKYELADADSVEGARRTTPHGGLCQTAAAPPRFGKFQRQALPNPRATLKPDTPMTSTPSLGAGELTQIFKQSEKPPSAWRVG